MNCKKCGAQMETDDLFCPVCGEQHEPEKADGAENTKKADKVDKEVVSPWKIILATALCMVLLMVLTVVVINSITGRNWPFDLIPEKTTAPTVATVPTTAPGTAEDLGLAMPEIVDIAVYTNEETAAQNGDAVITTHGKYQLTNSMLQVFYWTEFGNFVVSAVNNNQDLQSTYNLDIYSPLHSQKLAGYDVTWEQYFLHQALQNWLKYAVVNTLADEAGFEMDAESLASLETVPAKLIEDAKTEGYDDVEALIDDRLGKPCDLEDYVAYMQFTARGDLYYQNYLASYEPTDEEVEAFYELNTDYYAYYMGISKESGKSAAVRHILLQPEGCEFDENNYVVATDEQWEACRVAAQEMLDAWAKDGASEDAFAELAGEHTKDGGSQTTGGLYPTVTKGQMVQAFDAWVFDAARKAGDYGLVKTEFGYHLMYFVSLSEQDAWYVQAKADAKSYGYGFNLMVNKKMNENTPTFELTKVCLGDVSEEKPAETPAETTPATTGAAQ